MSSDGNADQIPLQFFPEIRHLIELRAAIGMNKYETTVRSRFPLFENFFARYDELPVEGRHAVMCHAENTYLTFLEQVHDAAERTADMLRCEITQILATFPSSWTSWVQKYHAVCLQMTWKLPLSSIELMYECEAIANSVLTRSATRYMDNPSPKKMLVVDLGAHVLVSETVFSRILWMGLGELTTASRASAVSVSSWVVQTSANFTCSKMVILAVSSSIIILPFVTRYAYASCL